MHKQQLTVAIASALGSIGAALASPNLVPVVVDGSTVMIDIDAIDKNDLPSKPFLVKGEDGVQYKVVTLEVGDTTVVIHRLGAEEQRYAMKTQAFKGMVLGSAELFGKTAGAQSEQATQIGARKPYLVVDLGKLKKAA